MIGNFFKLIFSGLNLSMWKVYAVILGLFLLLVGGVYLVFAFQNSQIKSLNEQHVKDSQALSQMKLAIAMEQKTIEGLKADAQQTKQLQDDLSKSLNDIRVETNQNKAKLDKHDLQIIGKAHPRMLEDRINKATSGVLKSFEDLSK